MTTTRKEDDLVEILSGVFEGRTTGTPISLMVRNTSQISKDYSEIASSYRPGHADYTFDSKYVNVVVDFKYESPCYGEDDRNSSCRIVWCGNKNT